jgi:hypothetical protein
MTLVPFSSLPSASTYERRRHLSLWDWLTSINTMISSSIHFFLMAE